MKIAMWSGPRNLSTAMMYSFGNRGDCAVIDEPFYAAYLSVSGADHPMRAEVLASQETDPEMVASMIAGPNPNGADFWYQKHMTHHMLPDFPLGWAAGMHNVFLIRHPARVVASYLAKRQSCSLSDIGVVRQYEIFENLKSDGSTPVVMDADRILSDAPNQLSDLCGKLGITYHDDMVSWSAGPRDEDGIWASHWYGSVHQSTGFSKQTNEMPELSSDLHSVVDEALIYYDQLLSFAL